MWTSLFFSLCCDKQVTHCPLVAAAVNCHFLSPYDDDDDDPSGSARSASTHASLQLSIWSPPVRDVHNLLTFSGLPSVADRALHAADRPSRRWGDEMCEPTLSIVWAGTPTPAARSLSHTHGHRRYTAPAALRGFLYLERPGGCNAWIGANGAPIFSENVFFAAAA